MKCRTIDTILCLVGLFSTCGVVVSGFSPVSPPRFPCPTQDIPTTSFRHGHGRRRPFTLLHYSTVSASASASPSAFSSNGRHSRQQHQQRQQKHNLDSSNPWIVLGFTTSQQHLHPQVAANRYQIQEIKRRYKSLAKIYHPDSNPNASPDEKRIASEKMGKINGAYQEAVAAAKAGKGGGASRSTAGGAAAGANSWSSAASSSTSSYSTSSSTTSPFARNSHTTSPFARNGHTTSPFARNRYADFRGQEQRRQQEQDRPRRRRPRQPPPPPPPPSSPFADDSSSSYSFARGRKNAYRRPTVRDFWVDPEVWQQQRSGGGIVDPAGPSEDYHDDDVHFNDPENSISEEQQQQQQEEAYQAYAYSTRSSNRCTDFGFHYKNENHHHVQHNKDTMEGWTTRPKEETAPSKSSTPASSDDDDDVGSGKADSDHWYFCDKGEQQVKTNADKKKRKSRSSRRPSSTSQQQQQQESYTFTGTKEDMSSSSNDFWRSREAAANDYSFSVEYCNRFGHVEAAAMNDEIFDDLVNFLDEHFFAADESEDSNLDWLLRTGTMEHIGQEMDDMELIVQSLSSVRAVVEAELVKAQAATEAGDDDDDDDMPVTILAELERRWEVVNVYRAKAGERHSAIERKYWEMVWGQARGPQQPPPPFSTPRDFPSNEFNADNGPDISGRRNSPGGFGSPFEGLHP